MYDEKKSKHRLPHGSKTLLELKHGVSYSFIWQVITGQKKSINEKEFQKDVIKLSSLQKQYLNEKKQNKLKCEEQNKKLRSKLTLQMRDVLGIKKER
ncbi:MAG: hypothetical protein N4A37_02890 [Prolixibacteraceae bacterium]|jgi:hypothetical protein|nr:hypothetical protein [Prolixibacteraceae bacterium]